LILQIKIGHPKRTAPSGASSHEIAGRVASPFAMLRAPRPLVGCLALVPFLLALEGDDTGVRLARAEGALESVRKEAESLSAHARKIVESGHFAGMSQLHGDALALHRQVLSAQLAVDFLRELDTP
jgi:hypothetical protein